MKVTIEEKQYKYRINELLDSLSFKLNRLALEVLPVQLEISAKTFANYRNIGIHDPQDIPHTVVAKLERFFDLQPGELQNYTIDIKPITQQTNSKASDTAALKKKFNLTTN